MTRLSEHLQEGLGACPSGAALSSLRDQAPSGLAPDGLQSTGARKRTLKESLARYMDPEAFREGVPDSVKFTSRAVGKAVHDKRKARREIAMKRAEAAIRFFSKPENRALLDQRKEASNAPE